ARAALGRGAARRARPSAIAWLGRAVTTRDTSARVELPSLLERLVFDVAQLWLSESTRRAADDEVHQPRLRSLTTHLHRALVDWTTRNPLDAELDPDTMRDFGPARMP